MARKTLTFSAETVTIYHLPWVTTCPGQKRIKPANQQSVKLEIRANGLPILQEGTRLCDFCKPYVKRDKNATKADTEVRIVPMGRSKKRQ